MIVIAYIPVPHKGYLELFERYRGGVLYVWGEEIIGQFPILRKDIRALPPNLVKEAIEAWGIFSRVEILDTATLGQLRFSGQAVVMPDEDVCHGLAERYGFKLVHFENTFLRWDSKRTLAPMPVEADRVIPVTELDYAMIRLAHNESRRSADWWRQVGGVIAIDGEVVLVGCNNHLPTPYTPYIDGDPRANFTKGMYVELATGAHIEAQLIPTAAARGIRLQGADVYVTDFPCPPCSVVVAFSGARRLYYTKGYTMVNGVGLLRDKGIEIIHVDIENPRSE